MAKILIKRFAYLSETTLKYNFQLEHFELEP